MNLGLKFLLKARLTIIGLFAAISLLPGGAIAQTKTWEKDSCGKIESFKTVAVSMIGVPGQIESPSMRIPDIYLRKYTPTQIANQFSETAAHTEIIITAIWPTLCPASAYSVNKSESRMVVDFTYAVSTRGYMGRMLKLLQRRFENIEPLAPDELSLHKFRMSRKATANTIDVDIVYSDVGLEATDGAKIVIQCVSPERNALCQVYVETGHNFFATLLIPRSELTTPNETGSALAALANEFISLGLNQK